MVGVRLDAWKSRTKHLYKFAETLLEELEAARGETSPVDVALAREVEVLGVSLKNMASRHLEEANGYQATIQKERASRAEEEDGLRRMLADREAAHRETVKGCRSEMADVQVRHDRAIQALEAELDAERKRHRDGVRGLAEDLRAAKRMRDHARQSVAARDSRIASLEDTSDTRRRDLERLQWHFHRAAPRGSVRKALGHTSITHWHRELAEGDAARQRVALEVLAFLPDRSEKTIDLILALAGKSAHLDSITMALKPIGQPAVLPLVKRAKKEGGAPRGWVLWTLGEMGRAAADALPWLREIAEDPAYGQDCDHARSAIKRIER